MVAAKSTLEESLLRSFSAIHHHQPLESDESPTAVVHMQSPLKRRRGGKGQRSVTPPVSPLAMPPPPFVAAEPRRAATTSREASRERPAKKVQRQPRRRVTITADVAQEMVHKIIDEKMHRPKGILKRRSTTETKPNFDLSDGAILAESSAVPQQQESSHGGYSLGETLRHPSHMLVEPLSVVASLNKHDFAFVKRSDGRYSYAILAYKSTQPIKGSDMTEECLVFVVNDEGATKMVRRRHWADFVRLPVVPSADDEEARPVSPSAPVLCREICQEVQACHDEAPAGWVGSSIEFDPQQVDEEECSVLSSVSERARASRSAR